MRPSAGPALGEVEAASSTSQRPLLGAWGLATEPGATAPGSTEPGATARILVVGMGNPLLGDDAVGWHVAERVSAWLRDEANAGHPHDADVDVMAVGGLALMERMVGYRVAISVDAAQLPGLAPGTVRALALDDVPWGSAGHLDSAHDTSLQTALRLGSRLGAALPDRVYVVAVQASPPEEFSEHLSAAVAEAIPVAADAVVSLLRSEE